MTRIRLDLAYDGTNFSGWAAQPGLRTVQGTLEDALRKLYRHLPDGPVLTVAGRTDAGVHATGQVAHFDIDADAWAATARSASDGPAAALVRRMTGILGLGTDVAVTAAREVPAAFDARFSALWRSYEYRLADLTATPNPLERHRTTLVRRAVDLAAMNAAAEVLIGLHDFAAFCKPREGATTIRTLQQFVWDALTPGTFRARLQADAFCHSMVRALVGMCVAVGQGRMPLARVPELLEQRTRANEFPVLAARGLVLTGVGYPPAAELATRQLATRAKRPAPPANGLAHGSSEGSASAGRHSAVLPGNTAPDTAR